MVDFTRGPGKILKYDSKRGKFCSLGPPFEVWAPAKITASPPPLYGPAGHKAGWAILLYIFRLKAKVADSARLIQAPL